MADPDAGYDFHPLRRSRIQRLDFRGARNRIDAWPTCMRPSTSACGTLKGPLHGGANEESMKMLDEIKTADRAEKWMMDALAGRRRSWASAIAFTKKATRACRSCARSARDLGKRLGREEWVPICEKLEATMEREKHLCANVDLYAAPVFTMLGFPPELNTPIFAVSRVAGWCAHVVEQHDNNRLDSSAFPLQRDTRTTV